MILYGYLQMKNSMNAKWLAISTLVVFVYLVVVNAFLFPIVFPDGLAEKFLNSRVENLPQFHLLAFAATSLILTILVDKLGRGRHSIATGLAAGGWLGLLVALPEHLHLFAMVDATAVRQIIPVVWTVVTWSLAGLLVGVIGGKVDSGQGIAD